MIKNVKWIFVVLIMTSLVSYSFVGKDTPTEGLTIGDKAPSFVVRSDNHQINLNDLKGKYVLLSFWASYDASSRAQNAMIDHATRQAKNLSMVSVSFDEYKSIFDETVKNDRLEEQQCYLDMKGESSALYKTYRLDRGFRNFLLNEKGVIIAKDITLSQLSSYLN